MEFSDRWFNWWLVKTKIPVNRLIFGTSALHKIARERDRIALLHCAYHVGFRHFDLASCYGGGITNGAFRKAFQNGPHDLTVSSKIGLVSSIGSPRSSLVYFLKRAMQPRTPALAPLSPTLRLFRDALEKERFSLDRDQLDYVFFHEPCARFLKSESFVGWVQGELKKSFLNFGVAGDSNSIYEWVRWSNHLPFHVVTQTKDSIEYREADFLLPLGRHREFTYGYVLGNKRPGSRPFDLADTLLVNRTGKVIYATTSIRRLEDLDFG